MHSQFTASSILFFTTIFITLTDSSVGHDLRIRAHLQTPVERNIHAVTAQRQETHPSPADFSNRFARAPDTTHLSTFSRNLHDMLSRLIPNRNLVEDLMGLPEPEISEETSHEIQNFYHRPAQPTRQIPSTPYTNLPQPKHEPIQIPHPPSKPLSYSAQNHNRPAYQHAEPYSPFRLDQSQKHNPPQRKIYTPTQQPNKLLKWSAPTPKGETVLTQQLHKSGEGWGKTLRADQGAKIEPRKPVSHKNKVNGNVWGKNLHKLPTTVTQQKEVIQPQTRTSNAGQKWLQALKSGYFQDIDSNPSYQSYSEKRPRIPQLGNDFVAATSRQSHEHATPGVPVPFPSSIYQQPTKPFISSNVKDEPTVIKLYKVMEGWANDSDGVE